MITRQPRAKVSAVMPYTLCFPRSETRSQLPRPESEARSRSERARALLKPTSSEKKHGTRLPPRCFCCRARARRPRRLAVCKYGPRVLVDGCIRVRAVGEQVQLPRNLGRGADFEEFPLN